MDQPKDITYGTVELPDNLEPHRGSPADDFQYTIYEAFEKSQYPSDKWYPYLSLYEAYLSKFRHHQLVTLVEVGVQEGGSLDMWGKFFPEAQIIGIDIDPKCYELQYTNKNISVVIGDAGDPKFWDDFLVRFNNASGIDIFIDDGGHFMNQQITTLEKVWSYMSQGSVYICEDAHTSYMPYNGGGIKRDGTFIEYAKTLIDVQHYSWMQSKTSDMMLKRKRFSNLKGIYFHDSFVVMEKDHPYFEMVRITNRDEQGNTCLKVVT
jgi:cephalosporin hydroxylase